MPREYIHIKQYENEMLQLKSEGLTYQQIGERLYQKMYVPKWYFIKSQI